jgi:hypothetical protein
MWKFPGAVAVRVGEFMSRQSQRQAQRPAQQGQGQGQGQGPAQGPAPRGGRGPGGRLGNAAAGDAVQGGRAPGGPARGGAEGGATERGAPSGGLVDWMGAGATRSAGPAVAPGQSPPSVAAGAPAAMVAPVAAGAPVAATTQAEAALLNSLRGQAKRPSPEWLRGVQAALQVPVDQRTGAMNTATVRALLPFREGKGITGDKLLDDPTVTALRVLVPGEPWLETLADAKKKNQAAKPGKDSPKDETAQAMGYADFAAWRAVWDTAYFLDKPVLGHPILLQRVTAADTYIRGRFPGQDAESIQGQLGWDGKIGGAYDHDASNQASHVHAMGIALDVSGPKNPWIFPAKTGGIAQAVQNMMRNASKLYGGEGAFDADDTLRWGEEQSTDEAYQELATRNESFKKYLDLGALSAAERLSAVQAAGIEGSEAKAIADKAKVHRDWWLGNKYRTTATKGFIDMNIELVRAFRDAGGLAWGATDWPEANGDTMHFDARTDSLGVQVKDAGKRASDRAAATARAARPAGS